MDTKRRKPEEVVAKLRHRSPMRSARSCRQSPNRPVAGAQSVSQRLVPSLAVARELASVVRADYVAPLPGAVRFNPRLALGRLSSHAPFEADRDELLRFDSEFHRQMLQHVPNKAVDDERRRFLCRQAALQAVKHLLIRNFGRGRLVFDHSGGVLGLDIRYRVGAAFVADQQGIAVGEIARSGRQSVHGRLPPIGVLRFAGRDALRDNAARRVAAEMNHLRAAVDLLMAVRNRNRIEFAARGLSAQYAGWIFPGDRGASLNLRPGDL